MRGGGKAVEKADFLKNEAQIGGEFRHGMVLLDGRHRLRCMLKRYERAFSSTALKKARRAARINETG